MYSTRSRRAAALFLAVALVLAATPVAAAPPTPGAGEPGTVLSVFESLGAWLSALWAGVGSAGTPMAARGSLDTGGEPGVAPDVGSGFEAAGEPTEDPERGSVADPNG